MAARARDAPGASGPGGDPAGRVGLLELEFAGGSLYVLRQVVAVRAAAAGMGEARARDVVLALNELASNAVSHGAGRGRLRMWSQDGALCCQVEDAGRAPRGGRRGADEEAGAAGWPYAHGHGLWVVGLLADQMSVASGPEGTCVTVRFALG
jgi:anti-sigma regulatory factor (Ser/Thr protein kinase)